MQKLSIVDAETLLYEPLDKPSFVVDGNGNGTFDRYGRNRNRTDHRIYYEDLYNAVLADIQYHTKLVYEDRDKAVALAVKMNKANGSREKANESKFGLTV